MAATELARQGWHLSEEGIAKCAEEGNSQRSDVIIKRALDTDLKEIGSKWLSEDINKGRVDCLEGPAVLQISKLRVVSAPKENEESQTAPRLCRVSLTDGRTTCSGVTLEVIKGIGPNTPPGSKILLSGPVEVESNFLLLTNKNVKFLGGNVENLAAAWELKKTLAQQTLIRNKMQEGGPPPFVPFGSKINRNEPIPPKKDFKSLASEKDKDPSAEDDKFLQQRQAVIQQALQAKSSGQGVKTSFGGGQKQVVKDVDVARIIEMGFSPHDASSALKQTGGNVQEAINTLVSGPQHGMGARFPDRGRPISGPREREPRGDRGDRRRGGREQRDDYDEDEYVSRPSGPATLFDFIEAKLLSKEDSTKADNKSSTGASKQSASSSSATTTTTTSSTTSHRDSSKYPSSGFQDPVFKHSSTDAKKPSGRPNTSQGFSSSADSSSKPYNKPTATSNYSQRNGSYNNSGDYGAKSTNKGYSDSNSAVGEDGVADRRQHSTLPPRFAKQRTAESYNRDNVEEHGDSRQRGRQSENNNDSYNQQGRYNKNYSSGPSDYQGRNRQSQNTSHYGKNNESYPNKPYNSNSNYPPKDHHYNSRKENASSSPDSNTNTSSPSQQSHPNDRNNRYSSPPNNQQHYNNNRNQDNDYEASSDRNHHQQQHPAYRGSYTHPAERGGAGSYNHPAERGHSAGSYHNHPAEKGHSAGSYNHPAEREGAGSYNHPAERGHAGSYQNPADRGPAGSYSNKYNNNHNRNDTMNPDQNYRQHQQQYQEPSYQQQQQQHPPRQSGRPPYNNNNNNNNKPRMDRRFPDSDGPYQVGEFVMAKYWEDNKFYRALVMAIGPPGTTVLVRFMDYGNEEDVLLTDVRPMQGQGGHMGGAGRGGHGAHGGQWGYHHQQSSGGGGGGGGMSRGAEYDPMAFGDSGHFVPPMQFSRGGQGSYGKGGGGPRKPTQSFYSPPNVK